MVCSLSLLSVRFSYFYNFPGRVDPSAGPINFYDLIGEVDCRKYK